MSYTWHLNKPSLLDIEVITEFLQYNLLVQSPGQKLHTIPHLSHLQHIPIREADPGPSRVPPATLDVSIPLAQKIPIADRLRAEVLVRLTFGDAVEVLCVQVVGGDQETARFLQDPKFGFSSSSLPVTSIVVRTIVIIIFLLVNVQHNRRPQTDRRHERIIRRSVLVRHDALARPVLVDEDVVRSAVGRVREAPQRVESRRDDGGHQPRGQRRGDQLVGFGERRRPCLETAVGELGPAGEGDGVYLVVTGQQGQIFFK